MKAQTRNPLEYHLEQILTNPQYLTSEQVARVRQLLDAHFPQPVSGTSDTSNGRDTSLKGQIDRMLRTLQKLESLTAASSDVGEIKQVLQASRDLFKLLADFKDELRAEERVNAIYESVIDSMNSFGDAALTAKFLEHYRSRLPKL